MELKTLKDLEGKFAEHFSEKFPASAEKEIIDMLKAEAIKWVKEDLDCKQFYGMSGLEAQDIFLDRWMKRLDITEEDLK